MNVRLLLDKGQLQFHVPVRRVNRGSTEYVGGSTIRTELERAEHSASHGWTSEQDVYNTIREGNSVARYLKVCLTHH